MIDQLRGIVYDYVGYKGGWSHQEVASAGIAWGGKAADAARQILALIA